MQSENPLSTGNLAPEIDIKTYARILWQWAWLLTLGVILAAVTAFVLSSQMTPIYQASTTLLIDAARNPTTSYQDIILSERIARTYSELMTQPATLEKVAEQFGLEVAVLEKEIVDIRITPIRDTQLVQVQVEGTSPQLVVAVADTLPTVFITEIGRSQTQRFAESKSSLQQQLDTLRGQIELIQIEIEEIGETSTPQEELELARLRSSLAQSESSYASLLQSFENLRLAEVQSVDSITVTQSAITPGSPIRPRILINTLLAAIVGGMLALGTIFLIVYLDDRIRSPDELSHLLGTACLGTLARIQPRKGSGTKNAVLSAQDTLITALEPRHPISESYRGLRTNLRFSNVDTELRSLLITSATPSEGKTTTITNLAIVMAQSGLSVVLVDADLRKPRLHKLFQLSQSPGLTDVLVQGEVSPHDYMRDTQVPNLKILASGKIPPNPAELLSSKRMGQIIEQIKERVDIVLFDAPPLLAVTDPQILATQVDGVVLVINTDKTQRGAVVQALDALQRVNARLLGGVLNQITHSSRSYYQYGYEYYYADDSVERSSTYNTNLINHNNIAREPIYNNGNISQEGMKSNGTVQTNGKITISKNSVLTNKRPQIAKRG